MLTAYLHFDDSQKQSEKALHSAPFRDALYHKVPMERINAFSIREIVVQADGDPARFAEPVRKAVTDLMPGLDVWGVKTLSETVLIRLRRERLLAWLSTAFGVLALILASIGLYGVVSYRVALRTQEIGIRLALGASRAACARFCCERSCEWLAWDWLWARRRRSR